MYADSMAESMGHHAGVTGPGRDGMRFELNEK